MNRNKGYRNNFDMNLPNNDILLQNYINTLIELQKIAIDINDKLNRNYNILLLNQENNKFMF